MFNMLFQRFTTKNNKCSTINIALTNLHHTIGGEREREGMKKHIYRETH